MAYSKNTWLDRAVQFATRYIKSGETSTSVTLTADPGTVTQAGTPVNAFYLNRMEQGIADAHVTADGALQRTGGTMTSTIYTRDVAVTPQGSVANTWSSALYFQFRDAANALQSNTFLQADPNGALKRSGLYQLWDESRMRVASGGTYVEWWNGSAWQGLGGIKGVQRGVSAFANSTITISAVNMNKSFVTFNNVGNLATDNSSVYRAVLVNSTTLQLSPAASSTSNANFAWEVVEFY